MSLIHLLDCPADVRLRPAQPAEWIERMRPGVVLLSVAPSDVRGMASPETMRAVEGYTLLRTDRNGWIELTTNGEQMWGGGEEQTRVS